MKKIELIGAVTAAVAGVAFLWVVLVTQGCSGVGTAQAVSAGLKVGSAICEAIEILGPPVVARHDTAGTRDIMSDRQAAPVWAMVFHDGTLIESRDGKTISCIQPMDAP